jgi:hypothetical protein
MRPRQYAELLTLSLISMTLAGCSVEVSGRDESGNAKVDVSTPAGGVSVRTDEPAETGLPVYPGATPLRERGESEQANVNVSAFGVGVRVAAGKFESADGNDKVLAFYRDAMRTYGSVTECEGDVDFEGDRAVCRPTRGERNRQLVVGREGDQRVVAVKARGDGSEISVVHVRVGG